MGVFFTIFDTWLQITNNLRKFIYRYIMAHNCPGNYNFVTVYVNVKIYIYIYIII